MEFYKECIIVPFSYDREKYGEIQRKDQWNTIFKAKAFNGNGDIWNEKGKKLLTEAGKSENERLMKRFKLSVQGRETCNLHWHKENKYKIECGTKEYRLQIEDVDVWFFRNGEGFFTIQIKNDFDRMSLEKAFELHTLRWFSSGVNFVWYAKKEAKKVINLKEFVEKCLGEDYELSIKFDINNEDKYNLSSIRTDSNDDLCTEERISKFCSCQKLNSPNIDSYKISYFEIEKYIHWAVSEMAVVAWGDLTAASVTNQRFLRRRFPESVFTNYLAVYLYYLSRYRVCKKGEEILKMVENDEIIKYEDKKLLQSITTKVEVLNNERTRMLFDTIFQEKLSGEQWKLQERLENVREGTKQLKKTKTDVFISYRHDGGQYLALLLYERLSRKGFTVFWDKKSLRAGTYDEQILKNLDECEKVIAILSPNSLKRLNEENDWVRKELAYAFEKGKKVLLVAMENERFPEEKDRENYPDEIKNITRCAGKEAHVELFDSAIESITEALKN